MFNNNQRPRPKLSASEKKNLIAQMLEAEEGITLDNRIQRRPNADQIPLSFAQRRLWFLEQLQPRTGVYNVQTALRLRGHLSVPDVEKAFATVAIRHQVLRARFIAIEGEPRQVLDPQNRFEVSVIDLRALPADEREAECRALVSAEAGRGVDLSEGPLFRPTLIRLTPDEHVLVISVHHIVCDAWSMGIILSEFAAHYSAALAHRSPAVPELPVQYFDYADWHNRQLEGPTLERQLTFWRHKLEGSATVLDLPTDYARPVEQTYRGEQYTHVIPQRLVEALSEAARSQGATLFMILLAGYKLMLAQRSGQSDILVGTPVAGRNRSETEPLVGCFVNTLVLRTCIDEHWTALDLVKAVRDTCLEAFGNNELPFEKLVAELRPERDLSRPPLAQAFFVLQNARSSSLNLPSIQVEALPLASATSKFEFSVDAFDTGNGLGLFFDYNPDLFSPATVQRMAHHFEAALDSIARNPETRLSDLPLLTEAERQQIVVGWNRTEVVHEGTGNTAQRILAQAAQTPTRIAIGFEGREVSYAELGQATEAIARKLRAVGVQPDTLTGVCLHRSPEMVIAALAVMHAGGAYVPLDPGFPPERLQYMLADSEATVLLTQASLRDEFAGFNGQVLCVEDLLADNEQSPAQDWAPAASDHLAYVIYTSGSTGKPKGVAIPQGALVNLLLSMRQTPGIAADDVLLAVTTLSFDIAGLELFLPLIAGARVELVSRDTAMNGERLAELLSANSISLMQATPATWRMVIDAGWQGSAGLKVLTGGEPLSPELRAELLRRCQSVWNVYGPTETTIWSTVERVLDEPGPVLIGRPIANTTIYILDRHGRPVPVGVSGELHIGGQGLARGYWKRQELTEEKFVWYTPMPGAPAERIYRTGDLARYRADGRIECLGRIDSQVKVRGYRIELGEIESVLRQQEGVQEAVVLAQEDAGGEKRLVAYLLAETGGGTLDTATLRAHAGRTLPDYMVPSAFVQLQQLPLTPNGKIDRKALRTEQPLAAPVAMQYAAPESDAEATIAAIWAELLRIPQVGRKDNFFDLGGHSLLLAKVHSRVRAAFPATDLSITEMFKYPTVTSLAERVARTASPSASNLGHRAELRRHAAAARLQD